MSYSRTELERLKAADLRPIAKELGITGASKRKKEENIVRIIDAQNEQATAKQELTEARSQPQSNEPMAELPSQAEDRIFRRRNVNNVLPITSQIAAEIGSQGIKSVAIYLFALFAKHDRKREARRFRKLVRRAGYNVEAGVDLRKYETDGELKKAA